jgi:hypothetical protein
MGGGAFLLNCLAALLIQGVAFFSGSMAAHAVEASGASGAARHAAAPSHLPAFITAPGQTDVLMVVTAVILVVATVMIGTLFLRLHTLPERMAHGTQKLQFEIVAVLGLLALFTHIHLFWVAGLLLALIDLPDFLTPLRRMAGSLETMARARGAETEAPAPTKPEEKALQDSDPPKDGLLSTPAIVLPVRSVPSS